MNTALGKGDERFVSFHYTRQKESHEYDLYKREDENKVGSSSIMCARLDNRILSPSSN